MLRKYLVPHSHLQVGGGKDRQDTQSVWAQGYCMHICSYTHPYRHTQTHASVCVLSNTLHWVHTSNLPKRLTSWIYQYGIQPHIHWRLLLYKLQYIYKKNWNSENRKQPSYLVMWLSLLQSQNTFFTCYLPSPRSGSVWWAQHELSSREMQKPSLGMYSGVYILLYCYWDTVPSDAPALIHCNHLKTTALLILFTFLIGNENISLFSFYYSLCKLHLNWDLTWLIHFPFPGAIANTKVYTACTKRLPTSSHSHSWGSQEGLVMVWIERIDPWTTAVVASHGGGCRMFEDLRHPINQRSITDDAVMQIASDMSSHHKLRLLLDNLYSQLQ